MYIIFFQWLQRSMRLILVQSTLKIKTAEALLMADNLKTFTSDQGLDEVYQDAMHGQEVQSVCLA